MIGKNFNNLTVIKRAEDHITPSGQKKVQWVCKCKCGNITIVSSQDLKSGHTKSCGCIPKKKKGSGLIDLTGKRFGKLVVLKRDEDYYYKNKEKIIASPRWLCQCDCGNIIVAQGGNLRSGNTTNCGCENKKSKSETIIDEFLTNKGVKFFREYTFDDLKNNRGNLLRFDFAILNDKNNVIILVEYQGEQHYIDCGSFGYYQRNYSDKEKKKYCETKKIPLYEIRYDEDINLSLNKLLNVINKIKKQ